MYVDLGAALDEDGEIDWDNTEVNEWDMFPLKREKV
jgi:hypothetical protein